MKKVVSVFLVVFLVFTSYTYTTAESYDEDLIEVWVLCCPDSYVNARLFPNRKGDIIGRLETGYKLYTDEVTRNGFLHCVGASLESSEVWVYKGYLIYDEPVIVNEEIEIRSRNRVIARKAIGGKKRCYVKCDDTVVVYYAGFDWSITNKGYIKTEFLDLDIMQYAAAY